VLELASDDEGHLHHVMPHRPAQPMALDDPALVGHQQIIHQVIEAPAPSPAETPARAWLVRRLPPLTAARSSTPTSAQAVASMLLNALVCPGLGSLVGGRPRAGISQLSIFLVGLPLAVASFGVPLMVAAWVWGVITGAHLIAEARD
jgi:TM2 domain-containing membrane protein YozV